MPTQTAYAVYSAKEKAKSSVSDFKRGMVQEQQSRQIGVVWEKQEQHRQNIADKRMDFKRHKKQGRHSERLTDQRQRELPVPMSDQPQSSKPSAEKMQEIKRPAKLDSKASETSQDKCYQRTSVSSGTSDKESDPVCTDTIGKM